MDSGDAEPASCVSASGFTVSKDAGARVIASLWRGSGGSVKVL